MQIAIQTGRRLDWAMGALVVLLTLICYWPAVHGELLWDDPAHVTRPDMRSWDGLARIWTEVRATQQYYPVLHSTFWFQHRIWGDSTFAYHLNNVLQHAAVSCLLALILRRLWSAPGVTGRPPESGGRRVPAGAEWVAAIIFAVHPVCVESVAWISEQKNTLSLLFYLLAGWIYLGFVDHRRPAAYAGATLFFLLALGTKTVTATLPAAILVVLWWRQGALDWRRDVMPLLPWFVLGIIAGLSTAWIEKNLIGAEGEAYELSLLQRTLLAGRILWFYIGSLVWPANLAFFYERWDVPAQAAGWTVYLIATVIVTLALWAIRGRSRGPLAVWLLFGGTLFPALGYFNVFPFAFSYVADHFQYHASVHFVAGFAAGAAILLQWIPRPARVAIAAGGGAVTLVTLVLLARAESRLYVDNETLFRANVERVPDNWAANEFLGWAITQEPGREREAVPLFERAIRLNPQSPDAYARLGAALLAIPERRHEAAALFERALELRPHFSEAHYHLAIEKQKDPNRLPEVIEHLEAAIKEKPRMTLARFHLANILIRVPERWPEAMAHYELVLEHEPDHAAAHAAYGFEMARVPARRGEALEHLRQAVSLNAESADAQFRLGHVLALDSERVVEAIPHLEAAARLNPRFPPAHFRLANALAFTGRIDEAIRHFETVLQIDPRFVEAYNGLAVLHARQGRIDEAARLWRLALDLDPDNETARESLRRIEQNQGG